VTLYVVEHRLPGAAAGDLEQLREALREITRRLTAAADGNSAITYLRSTVVPSEHRCICLFEATSSDLVRRANELAQAPIASLSEAVDFSMSP
jgi:hypothetical protein